MCTKSSQHGGRIPTSRSSSGLQVSICESMAPKQSLIWYSENQITPFNFSTPDGEIIYAWHVMPLGLYAKHESEILQQPSGCAKDITKTKAFRLLRDEPDTRLIINCEFSNDSLASIDQD
jgi:hypothetical protein